MDNSYEVITRIEQRWPTMSKGQKRIAAFIHANYDRAAFMTAMELGVASQVSESTAVRFAMMLGYEGFPQLQTALEAMVRNRLTSEQRIHLIEEGDETTALRRVLRDDMTNLRETIEQIDYQALTKVIDCLVGSESIYVCGHRSSSPLAQFLEYYLSYVFAHVHLIVTGANDYYDRLARMGEKDVLICLSFPRYSMRTVEVSRIARQKGATVCAITDSLQSPIARVADHCLLARTSMASFVDSVVAPMSVINALIVGCGQRKRGDLEKHFAELESLWNRYQVYTEVDRRNGEA